MPAERNPILRDSAHWAHDMVAQTYEGRGRAYARYLGPAVATYRRALYRYEVELDAGRSAGRNVTSAELADMSDVVALARHGVEEIHRIYGVPEQDWTRAEMTAWLDPEQSRASGRP